MTVLNMHARAKLWIQIQILFVCVKVGVDPNLKVHYSDIKHCLKGKSHENLLCFYWYRWKAKIILNSFYFNHFLKYRRFHVEFLIIR
jgi:hypothetical protein